MELDILVESQLIVPLDKLKVLPNRNAIIKSIEQLFSYKNPKFIENEKWGYSNFNTPKYLKSYSLDFNKMYISRGGLDKLENHLKKFNIKCNWIDRTLVCESVSFDQSKVIRRPDQQKFINEMLKHTQGCGQAYTAFGKCHEKGSPILLHDGQIKKVENVIVGDKLMGPDSKPRNVLSLGRGSSIMYEIQPVRGEPFTVNEDHILSLRVTGNSRHRDGSTKWPKDSIHNVSVKDYLNYSKGLKHILKLWKTGVNFKEQKVPYSPYFIGLWLGDGSKREAHISNNDEPEIVSYLHNFCKLNGLKLKREQNVEKGIVKCSLYKLKGLTNENLLRQYLRSECTLNVQEKNIPDVYKINSEYNRLELLAGIIDSDGYLVNDKRTYEVAVKKKHLAEQVVYLSRSLGFSCRIHEKPSRYKKDGITINCGVHYRLCISGETYKIPVLLKRKIATTEISKVNQLNSGFKVIKKPVDDYYGFTIDRDSLYLMGCFTVTHNTLTALELAKEIGQPVLVIVHTSFIQEQWIQEALGPFNLGSNEIGGVGGIFGSTKGFKEYFKGQKTEKRRYRKLNICLYHSLQNPEHMNFFKDRVGLVLFDEGQKTPIEAVQGEVNHFRARYRYTVSADFKRKDGKEFLTFDTFGPVRHIAIERNSASKILCKINLVSSDTTDYMYEEDGQYSSLITRLGNDRKRNILICRRAIRQVKKGKLVLIFVERKAQAGILAKMLSKFRVDMLLGGSPSPAQLAELPPSVARILKMYDGKTAYKRIETLAEHKKLDIIIGTQKAEVGLNLRTIDHGIVTTPLGKNPERFKQVKGRIERTYSDKMVEYFGHKKSVPELDVIVDYNIRPSRDAAEVIKEVWGDVVRKVKKKKPTIIRKRRS